MSLCSPGPTGARMRWLRAGLMLAAAALLGGCFSLPTRPPLPPSPAMDAVAPGPLAALAPPLPADAGDEACGLRLMPEGATAFNARIALIRQARWSIDAQYYILEADGVGARFLRELLDASRRGVRVRLLVDGLYLAGKDELLDRLAAQPNFEVRVFNPLPVQRGPLLWRLAWSVGELSRIDHRMHNKLFVVDGSVAVMGGRNMADEYFMQSGTANFVDMDVLVTGPLVRSLSARFGDYWASDAVWTVRQLRPTPPPDDPARLDALLKAALPGLVPERERDVLGQAPVAPELAAGRLGQTPARARVYADTPDKMALGDDQARYADSVTAHTLAAIAAAREQVILVSPYFIPGERGMAQLQANAARGVRTMVVTNALDATDEPLVHAHYALYRRLLNLGVNVFELGARLAPGNRQLGDFGASAGRLHAKLALIDDRQLFVGSMNLDGRSARVNTEIGLIIDSPVLAAQFHRLAPVRSLDAYELRLSAGGDMEWVQRDPQGREHLLKDEPGAAWWRNLRTLLLRPLVPEGLL